MTTTDWVWFIVIAVFVLALIGGVVLSGSYLASRKRREARARRLESQAQPPLSPPTSETLLPPHPPPVEGPRIRWGEVQPRAPLEPNRLRWGTEWVWTEISPPDNMSETDSEALKCPICRNKFTETQRLRGEVIDCPYGCGTLYHQQCWDALPNQKCSVCGTQPS